MQTDLSLNSVSASLLLPTEIKDLQLGMLSAKAQVLRLHRFRLAVHGALLFGNATDASSDEAGLVGGIATYCFDDACNSNASAYAGVGLFHDSGTGVPFLVSGSLTIQAVEHLKFVAEALTAFSTDDVVGEDSGFIGFYGVRVTHKNFGLNVGFVRPFGTNVSVSGPGEIVASITGRFVP